MATRVPTCEIGLDVGSDHLPVHLTINSSKIIRQNKKDIIQHEKTDWSRFKKYIISNLIMTEAEWPSEIDVACDTLANIIKAALDKSCPKSTVKDTDFFISKETSKLIKLKRKIRRIAQKTQDPIHRRLANQLKIIVAKAVKNDQDTWWRKNTKDLDEAKDSRMLWNTFNRISGKKSQTTNNNPVINSNGKSTENDKEKANAFAKTLGKNSQYPPWTHFKRQI